MNRQKYLNRNIVSSGLRHTKVSDMSEITFFYIYIWALAAFTWIKKIPERRKTSDIILRSHSEFWSPFGKSHPVIKQPDLYRSLGIFYFQRRATLYLLPEIIFISAAKSRSLWSWVIYLATYEYVINKRRDASSRTGSLYLFEAHWRSLTGTVNRKCCIWLANSRVSCSRQTERVRKRQKQQTEVPCSKMDYRIYERNNGKWFDITHMTLPSSRSCTK